MAENTLRTELKFGDLRIRFYAPEISSTLSLRADSAKVHSPDFDLHLVLPYARLVDWFSFRPTQSVAYVRVDSVSLRMRKGQDTTSKPVVFPEALRFPVSVRLEWRVLAFEPVDGRGLEIRAAQLQSLGRLSMQGNFWVVPYAGSVDSTKAELMAKVQARAQWRGPVVRYAVEAQRGENDRVTLSGVRDKRDLRLGRDSAEAQVAQVADWLPPGAGAGALEGAGMVSGVKLKAQADWRTRNIHVTGGARSAARDPLSACDWTFEARTNPRGGSMALEGKGEGQTLEARGTWSHPESWPGPGSLKNCRGDFTAEAKGGVWKIGHWVLPLDVQVPSLRLEKGLNVTARIVTGSKSEIDVAWNGDRPGRLEFEGPVSPKEPWAIAWTDTNFSFREGRLKGVWEDGRVTGVTQLRGIRAYGASADSLFAGHEVSAHQYRLTAAQIFKGPDVFSGTGHVRWNTKVPRGSPGAWSLQFEARHPEYGFGVFHMPRPGMVEISADNLRLAQYPYEPLTRFAAFNPWVDGLFRWDLVNGWGEADLSASYASGENVLQARLLADWDRDSLRARSAEMTTGPSRISAEGIFPLGGRSLRGLYGIPSLMGGTWKVRADSIRIGDIYALAGRSARLMDGHVRGALEYSPALGLAGEVRSGPLRIPALRDWLQVTGATLTGLGDSLRVRAVTESKLHPVLNDTLTAIFSDLDSPSPRFRFGAFSGEGIGKGFWLSAEGSAPDWKQLQGVVSAFGTIPVNNLPAAGSLDSVALEGTLTAPLDRNFLQGLRFEGRRLQVRYAIAGDTQTLSGTPLYADGTLRIADLSLRDARSGGVTGSFYATHTPPAARLDFKGDHLGLFLAQGHRFAAEDVAGRARWEAGGDLTASVTARAGTFAMPPTPYRLQGSYDALRVDITLPPPGLTPPPSKLYVRAGIHDFFFQRKIKLGFREVWGLFSSLGRSRTTTATGKRSRVWDLDVGVNAKGSANRIDTDVLRMNFLGEMRLQGIPPYTLVNGRVTGLQGEVGQVQQAYTIRDLEVKWDNATLQDGLLSAEGEKKLRADCRPDTRSTCMMYIRLDGRLQDVNFTYDTDCGQNTGEAVAPAVLLRSMTQGCYAAELQSGESGYGNAAVGIVEPVINAQLTSGIARRSGGFIKSTQVSGLGALMGSDSSGFEAVAIEVESREVYRTGFKARLGYLPETKQANPTEYRLAAEYRPPLERWASDSAWRVRLKDRFTVEAAVETRPEVRDSEEDRQVRQRAGLRYRYRFWGLW